MNERNEALHYTIKKEAPSPITNINEVIFQNQQYKVENNTGIKISIERGSLYKFQYIIINSSFLQTDFPSFDILKLISTNENIAHFTWTPNYSSEKNDKTYDYVFLYLTSPNGDVFLDAICVEVLIDDINNVLSYGEVHHYQKMEMLMFEKYLDDSDPLKQIASYYKKVYDMIIY